MAFCWYNAGSSKVCTEILFIYGSTWLTKLSCSRPYQIWGVTGFDSDEINSFPFDGSNLSETGALRLGTFRSLEACDHLVQMKLLVSYSRRCP